MADETARQQIAGWYDDILKTYGPIEGTRIVAAASKRLEDSDGGTIEDWYAALTAAILERHPDVMDSEEPQN